MGSVRRSVKSRRVADVLASCRVVVAGQLGLTRCCVRRCWLEIDATYVCLATLNTCNFIAHRHFCTVTIASGIFHSMNSTRSIDSCPGVGLSMATQSFVYLFTRFFV